MGTDQIFTNFRKVAKACVVIT